MNTALAIIAHEKAAPTIADFEPQWEKLGLDVLVFLPAGETWTGTIPASIYAHGTGVHRGHAAYERFCNVIEELIRTGYDSYIVAEYDTVNLAADLPQAVSGHLSASFCQTTGPDVERVTGRKAYYIALSPWCMERNTAIRLLVAMWDRLGSDKHEEWIGGYLDRWVASVALEAGIPCARIGNACGWLHGIDGIHDKIKENAFTWIHGWKAKSDFQNLWPQQS